MASELLSTGYTEVSSTYQLPDQEIDLSQWIYEMTHAYVHGKILEIGSGNGIMCNQFISNGISLRISDPNRECSELLAKQFMGNKLIKGVHKIDLNHEQFESKYIQYLSRFNVVLSLNVTEDLIHNKRSIANAEKLLKERGCIIIQLPAPVALYNKLDEGVTSWRKQNKYYLKMLLGKETEIVKIIFFNISTHTVIEQPSLYHQFVKSFTQAGSDGPYRMGLSMLAVARKK